MPRVSPIEPRRSFSIYLPNSLYQKLEKKAGRGRLNTFINQVLEEKLIKEEQKEVKEFRQKLVDGYKRVAKNKKLQKEVEIWDETLNDAWKKNK